MTELRTLANERERRAHSFEFGYMPPKELVIDPSLRMHSSYVETMDPVTYEVLRSKLWNINADHQETIRRVSGSQVVVFGHDFNTSIQTEDGAGVCFGPGNLFFGGCADLVTKWTLEHRSMNVGIHEGDVFVQDDPWVGTNHQMDTAVYAPVFWDGGLFAWVYSVVHQRELGGIEPGGFVQQASDVYSEATFWPPMKLIDRGTLREDVVDAWVRRSRLPQLMTLELRSQVAGVEFARAALLAVVERYGADQVKGTMRKMIKTTARTVAERISKLPDGEWSDTRYVSGAIVGDLSPYRTCLTVRKQGDRLVYSNAGTDPSVGSFNITGGVLRAAIVNSLLTFLCYDQYLCAAGLLEQVDFEFEPGAITSAKHPAAVSTSMGLVLSLVQGQYLNAKLLSTNPETAHYTFAASAAATFVSTATFGVDQYGKPTAQFLIDCIVGGLGAFPWRDGLDHGGTFNSPISPVGSVEEMERETPILYLYRREAGESGGHGRWRGGACLTAAYVGHRTKEQFISSGGFVQSVTQSHGLLGGLPATGGTLYRAEGVPVGDWFAQGQLPGSPAELRELTELELTPPKKFDNRLIDCDVFEIVPSPGAGYGDPILRAPDLVARDVEDGKLSREHARAIYGAVVTPGATVDAEATASERERLRTDRLSRASAPRRAATGRLRAAAAHALSTVILGPRESDDAPMLGCAHCRRALAPADGNYRFGTHELHTNMADLGPYFIDPAVQTGHNLVWRTFLCPDCGVALDGELCRPTDEPAWDVRLAQTTIDGTGTVAHKSAGPGHAVLSSAGGT